MKQFKALTIVTCSRKFHLQLFNILLLLFSRQVVSDSVIPWTAARQTSLSLTISQSLLKFMSIELVAYLLCRGVSHSVLPDSLYDINILLLEYLFDFVLLIQKSAPHWLLNEIKIYMFVKPGEIFKFFARGLYFSYETV